MMLFSFSSRLATFFFFCFAFWALSEKIISHISDGKGETWITSRAGMAGVSVASFTLFERSFPSVKVFGAFEHSKRFTVKITRFGEFFDTFGEFKWFNLSFTWFYFVEFLKKITINFQKQGLTILNLKLIKLTLKTTFGDFQ